MGQNWVEVDHLWVLQIFESLASFPIDKHKEACKVSDLGTDHLLIVKRLKVIDDPLVHFVFHHGMKHLCGYLAPPLGILMEGFPTLLFNPLKNCAVESYLSIELIILQEGIGYFFPTRGIFQSHKPCGHRANQVIRENLREIGHVP